MMSSSASYVTPLSSVPGLLIQAIGTSGSYRLAAEQLLTQAWSLDAHLSPAIEAEPVEGGSDYFLNLGRLDWNASREIFTGIRERREQVEASHSLLGHVANLIDYVSHVTTNLLPLLKPGKHPLASVRGSDRVEYAGEPNNSFELSIGLYMGLSPLPVFGMSLPYEDEKTARALRRFGFGAIAYLTLALQPELANGRLPPEINRGGFARPMACPPIAREHDGSIVLLEDAAV